MADDRAQLYTIEGLTAGLIMIATAYFVLNTGFMYAPGDAHIADMQLEQIGNDALLMMDTPVNDSVGSKLEGYVNEFDGTRWDSFNTTLNNYLRMNTGATSMVNNIRYNASIYYRKSSTDEVGDFEFGHYGVLVAHEPAVSVSRLVYCNNNPPPPCDPRSQELIFEVILWRG